MLLTLALMFAASPQGCETKMLDYSTWREEPGQEWDFRWPEHRETQVTILGAEHLRDQSDPQFGRIKAAFDSAQPTLAFFEGPDRGTAGTREDAIRTMGESGYVRYLAAAAGIPARTIEMSPPAQVKALVGAFPADQVLLFFLLREASRLRDREGLDHAALNSAMAKLLERVTPMASAMGVPVLPDVEALGALTHRYWPDRDWRDIPADWFTPIAAQASADALFLPAINRADSANRNRHMTRLIADAARAGERPLLVVGRNHVSMIAPTLRCMLESTSDAAP